MNDFLLSFVAILANVLYVALIGRVIISWINLGADHPIVAVIYQITEPVLAPIRRVLPSMGMFDFSPMVAILLIALIRSVFTRALA